jgi:predicted DNA-binding transcriptional regulator AlpA
MYSTALSKEERRAGVGVDRVRSLAETARLIGISLPTLRRLIANGTGPRTVRPSPRRIGVRDSDREAYLDAKASGATRVVVP